MPEPGRLEVRVQLKSSTWALAAVVAAWGFGAAALRAAPEAGKRPLSLGLTCSAGRWVSTRHATGPLTAAPVPNFGVVAPGCVYRSGQPGNGGFDWLKNEGFRAVVCLRKEHDDGAAAMTERGFQYLYLPVAEDQPPTADQAETFLDFAADRSHWPLLVHCQGGDGRAATMAALIRYSCDGWFMDQAMEEATRYRRRSVLHASLSQPQRAFLERWAKTHPRGGLRPAGEPARDDSGGSS
jgi:protein tyrosine phosphatase (PTP) superfamily phosphohydrolase (DUF442 family)